MLEEPFLREFARIGEVVDGEFANVVDRFVKLGDLGGSEGVAVLFWMNLGVVEYLVASEGILVD